MPAIVDAPVSLPISFTVWRRPMAFSQMPRRAGVALVVVSSTACMLQRFLASWMCSLDSSTEPELVGGGSHIMRAGLPMLRVADHRNPRVSFHLPGERRCRSLACSAVLEREGRVASRGQDVNAKRASICVWGSLLWCKVRSRELVF